MSPGFNWGGRKTAGGYAFGECVSALQKAIRRSEEVEAMYWAIEVESIDWKYLVNRLRVITSEDIGPANPTLCITVDILMRNYEDCRRRRSGSLRNFLGHCILAMCRSPKSRIVDDFQIALYRWPVHLDIPDHALDQHTGRGRRMGRGSEHFREIATIIADDAELPRASEYRDLAHRLKNVDGAQMRYDAFAPGQRSQRGDTAAGSGEAEEEQESFDLS